MKRIIGLLVAVLVALPLVLFGALLFTPRPDLTIDPVTLAGDGSVIDYCDLPVLDGSGKRAEEIPKGNTPGCGYEHFPLPILRECTEPLVAGADDIRGLWRGVDGAHVGHVERIEQCGSRVVVTTSGIIHDYGPNSTAHPNTNDTEGRVVFSVGDRDFCPRTSASMIWEEGILNFYVLGWGPLVVRRYLDGEEMVWEYADGSVTRLERICSLPAENRTPAPRGPRIRLW